MKRAEIERQLAKILASKYFRGSDRRDMGPTKARAARQLAGLLKFLVTRELDGLEITDAIVTREYFGKEPQTFEKGQAIARVETRLLRTKLTEYYSTVGIDDPVSIDIPIGSPRPVFDFRDREPASKELELGLHQIDLEAPIHIERALAHFDEAIRLRPADAEGHAGKAMALTTYTLHEITAPAPAKLLQAETAARKAIELNASSWRAHAALGGVVMFRQKWAEADLHFRSAVTIDSRKTGDHGAYGLYLLGRGRYLEGRRLAERYENEHPTELTFLKRAALYIYAMRRFGEAERLLDMVFAQSEHLWHAHHLRALICLAKDQPEKAFYHLREMNSLTHADLWPGLHILCLARTGNREEAAARLSVLKDANRASYVQPRQLALGYIALDQPLEAIDCLARGARDGDPFMLWLHLWPFVDPLRKYPQFDELLERLGLPSPPRMEDLNG